MSSRAPNLLGLSFMCYTRCGSAPIWSLCPMWHTLLYRRHFIYAICGKPSCVMELTRKISCDYIVVEDHLFICPFETTECIRRQRRTVSLEMIFTGNKQQYDARNFSLRLFIYLVTINDIKHSSPSV